METETPADPKAPQPIDPRGPRFNQAVVAVLLFAAFLFDWPPVVPLVGLALLLGAAFGPRYGPFLRLYAEAIRPRLGPPTEVEDPRPPRFSATLGGVFLGVASIALATGHPRVGWTLVLIVATLAGVAAVTALCVGCELYVLWARHQGRELVGR